MGIGMLLDMALAAHPDRIAVGRRAAGRGPGGAPDRLTDGPAGGLPGGDAALTYADLARIAAGGAGLLQAAKARHVVHVGVNGPLFPALLFACAHAGLPLTPLNYRLSPAQLHDLIGGLDDPLVVADRVYADALAAAPAGVRAPGVDGAAWLAGAAAAEPVATAEDDDAAAGGAV
ncbi:AMP-binding protein, partial [Yinghuangia soli]|nr:hypothetical protein [Yinghuangia soli]